MATVLVVDDNAANRELVVTLLRHRGHEPLEATDGADALALVRARRPDLVISDILMPTMDGYDLVRQLRDDPALARTEVVFWSAHYREREARNLAAACGVSRVLLKPSEPEDILRTIDEALAHAPPAAPTQIGEAFDREHLRLMADKLSQKVDELAATNRRLAALNDINLQLGSELDPRVLLEKVCRAARDLIGARYALLCVRHRYDDPVFFTTSGVGPAYAALLKPPRIENGPLGPGLPGRASRRFVNPGSDPAAAGLPAGFPRVRACLAAPVASLKSVYGWICLADKLGASEFDDEDERLLTTLAAQVGRIYENGTLYAEVRKHATRLQNEVTERKQAEVRIQRLNRVHAMLSGINALIVRLRERDELFRAACRLAVEQGRFQLAWIGRVDRAAGEIVPAAWAGEEESFGRLLRIPLADGDDDDLLAASAAIRVPIAIDVDAPSTRLRLREEMLAHDFHSAAGFPLVAGGDVVGYLAFFTDEAGFFDDDEMRLLRELAGDLAFALEHIAAAERLDYLASHDPLTGLANRALFVERLAQYANAAAHAGSRLAVVVADVERFRTVNETLGRHAGDELLKQLAQRLRAAVGNANELARIGSDQFAVVLPAVAGGDDAIRTVERWRGEALGAPFAVDGSELRLAAKAGLALHPEDGRDAEALLRNAEAALDKAKAAGEPYLFYAQQMTDRVAEKLTLESRLRRALERDELVLHYQPKVDVETRRIAGIEALMRWQSPELGLVAPARFIPLMEETGLILEAGAWALARAAADRARWRRNGGEVPRVAVNISAVQLRRPDFVATVLDALGTDAAAVGIDLEVTESLIMADVDANIEKLRALRERGLAIAIDDFGTGYSSLAYLARLPVGTIKVDGSFVGAMLESPAAMTLVSTMIALAHSLGLLVIAECVERDEQAKILRLLRCDQMQGFLVGRPVPADDVSALLARTAANVAQRGNDPSLPGSG